jgi:hypothetical protein
MWVFSGSVALLPPLHRALGSGGPFDRRPPPRLASDGLRRGGPMTGGTFTTTIQMAPEKVWAVVADFGTHASWCPAVPRDQP